MGLNEGTPLASPLVLPPAMLTVPLLVLVPVAPTTPLVPSLMLLLAPPLMPILAAPLDSKIRTYFQKSNFRDPILAKSQLIDVAESVSLQRTNSKILRHQPSISQGIQSWLKLWHGNASYLERDSRSVECI
ncbi:hypothetical protein Mp_3g21750 [Marchantia polymorpha subsp. ruderalis]|uniref:Uncharacterized protein n=2 Tax=Marchantia polymorpha TaxID=3197 RepID=A0AAF6B3C2_MARPO|nr:hypothetical protein MARPO_0089s0041 [Marchantia polymorpha]BBN06506.1 hypothetical protein Mp_3g21750 [Marchantia polymorpha subsp. ruderalis]|eukprot:PTQ33413.1 hypothetical protein MARPO_0089s0041 [Marchantia polymorpha]